MFGVYIGTFVEVCGAFGVITSMSLHSAVCALAALFSALVSSVF